MVKATKKDQKYLQDRINDAFDQIKVNLAIIQQFDPQTGPYNKYRRKAIDAHSRDAKQLIDGCIRDMRVK